MSKKIKDVFDAFDAAELTPSSVQVVDKKAEKVEVTADVVIVDGSASKAAIYGAGGEFVAKGYAGKGSVKSVAGVELTAETADVDSAAVTVDTGLTAKMVAGAKVDFAKEDKKYIPTDTKTNQVTIGETSVTVLDAKVTDVFGGAVLTDTATSKKYKVEVAPTVEKASVAVMGGTVTNVYGGGTGALSAVKDVDMFISGGKISNVYAGGKDGAVVNGDVNVYVDMNSAAAAAAMNVGKIYAGGKDANVFGDVTVTVTTNGAMGSNGKIGQIIGTPAGKGVVVGSKNLVLDAYQGEFAATVKNMDTVTIAGNSAVTFTKGQDKSMRNAEYIIEVSEIDNSNQAAILTLKSDYQLNKLTVSIDADLIAEGSFSRALVQGVKGKFNSSKFDVNQVNVISDEGLVADYQYELVFETELKGNKEVETGKLVFTYTGATLELSVDGYVNRQGVANVLTSANDIVSFGWSYDEINKNYDREIAYNFKTMGGNDTVTIDANTYFTGKLSLGSGNDKLTINGALAKLDLSGAGENTVIINDGAALDARNITTSADSVNTFVVNGFFSEVEIDDYAGQVKERVRVIFTYADGSTTENEIQKGKKIVMATRGFYDANGAWNEVTEPWVDGASVDAIEQWLENADQFVQRYAKQDVALMSGDNTIVVNNAAGVADITLAGKNAKVWLADKYEGKIDLRSAETSTLVIDHEDAAAEFTGSRRGTSTVVIAAKKYESTIADLDLKYHQAALKLEDAVVLTVKDGWDTAGLEIEDVQFGFNAELNVKGSNNAELNGTYLKDFTGYKYTDNNLTVFGTLQNAVVDFDGEKLNLNNVAGSEVYVMQKKADVIVDGDISASYIEFEKNAKLTLNGVVDADSEIAITGKKLQLTFRGDTEFNGLLNVGKNTANIALQEANLVFGGTIDADEFVDNVGTVDGEVNLKMVESTITLNSDMNVNNLEITVFGDVLGEGKLNVTGDVAITGADFTFGNDQAINVLEANQVTITDSNITIADDYTLQASDVDFANSTVSGNAIEAQDVDFVDSVVTLNSLKSEQDVDFVESVVTLNSLKSEGTVSFSYGTEATVGAIEAAKVFVDNSTLSQSAVTGDLSADNATLTEVQVSGAADVVDSTVDGAAFGSLVAEDADLTDVVVAGDAELGLVDIYGTFAADKVTLTDGIGLNDESSFTANEVTADGNTIYFGSDVSVDVDLFKGDVKFFGDKMNVVGLKVDGELDLTDVNALSGDVRVYGYSDKSSANPYEWVANQIKVSDIALDGNFEADITADDVAAIELSDTTRIERLNDELFNTKPYGSLNFNGATAADEANKLTVNNQAVDGNYAFVEKGVMSEGNLDVIGNVEADFAVKGVMTLGEGAEYEDYVTLEDDAKPAANANIKGDVTADALVAAGAESVNTVTGNVATYAVSVKKGGNLTVTGATDTGYLTLDVEDTDKTAADYVGQQLQSGAVATFNGDVKAAIVTLGDNIAANEIAGAKLDITGNLDTTSVTVGTEGEVNVGSMAIAGGNVLVKEDASFTAGDVAQKGTSKFDAAADGAAITMGDVTFEDLTLDGNVTVGKLTVGTVDGADKFDKALLNIASTDVTLGGDITMDADVVNTLSLAQDMAVAGKVDFAQGAAANTLNINGSATFDGGLHFNKNLTMAFEDAIDADGVAYAKFNSDITMSDDDEKLTVNKTAGAATVEMQAIDFGAGVDELAINANVSANGVTAAGDLKVSGNGALTSQVDVAGNLAFDNTVAITGDVNVGKALTMDDNTINGNVVVGVDMFVTGDAVINSENALDLSAAKLAMTSASLTVNAINGGADFQVAVTGENTINANINADKMIVVGNALAINGDVSGAIDATALETFGGKNTVAGGVTFDKLTVAKAESRADFTAKNYAVDGLSDADEVYQWIEGAGPVAVGAHKETNYNSNTLAVNSSAIIGTVKMGEGADTVSVVSDTFNYIAHVEMGNSINFKKDKVLLDTIAASGDTAAALSVQDIKFNNALMLGKNPGGTDGALYIDRNYMLVDKVNAVNEQIMGIVEAIVEPGLENGGYTAGDLSSTGFSFTMDGKTYDVVFGIKDDTLPAEDLYKPANVTVTVDGLDYATVKGTDEVNMLAVVTDTYIDGSIAMGAGNDNVTVALADLTLNALKMDGFISGFEFDVTNLEWVIAGYANAEFANSNILDFGAGEDTLTVYDGTVSAAQVKYDMLTVSGSAYATIAADMIGAELVVTESGLTVEGSIVSDTITVNVGSAVYVDPNYGYIFADTINLNGSVTYVDHDDDPATDAKPEADYAYLHGVVVAGEELTINNVMDVTGEKNTTETMVAEANEIGSIVGLEKDGVLVSNVIINTTEIADVHATVGDAAGLVIRGTVTDLNSLVVNGDAMVLSVSGVGGAIANVSNIEVHGGALFVENGIEFTNTKIEGDVISNDDIVGTEGADKLVLSSSTIDFTSSNVIDFGENAEGIVDVLEITGSSESVINGLVWFDRGLEIRGTASVATLKLAGIAGLTANDNLVVNALVGVGTINSVEVVTLNNVISVETISGVNSFVMGDDVLAADNSIINFSESALNSSAINLDLSNWSAEEIGALSGKSLVLVDNTNDLGANFTVAGDGWTGLTYASGSINAEITFDTDKYVLTIA